MSRHRGCEITQVKLHRARRWAQTKGHTCGFTKPSHLIWHCWLLTDDGKFQSCKSYQESLPACISPLICLWTVARAPGQPLLPLIPDSPPCCRRAVRTYWCRVFCERILGLALTLSHLSELYKIFPYGLLAT